MHRAHVLLLALACSACVPSFQATRASTAAPSDVPVTVQVDNRFNHLADVYAVGRGGTWHLGRAQPGMISRFNVPQGLLASGPLEIVTDMRNGEAPVRSLQLQLIPGDVVDVQLDLGRMTSSAELRPRR